MKRLFFIIALILAVSGFVYASTYTGADPEDLDKTTPTEGSSPPSEINDSIREIKTVYLNQMAVNSGGATTLGSTNSVYLCTTAGTITLPSLNSVSSASVRKDYWILNESTGTCVVDGNGSETIDGALTASLTKQYQPLHLIANTSGWYSTNAAYIANSPVTGAGYKYLLINASGVLPDNIADGAGSTLDADTLDSYNTALGNTTATTTRIIPAINSTGLDVSYIPQATNSVTASELTDQNSSVNIMVANIPIGDWNMDTGVSGTVAHGLTGTKIIGAQAFIRNDANSYRYPLNAPAGIIGSDTTPQGGIYSIDGTNITLTRLTGGLFDSAAFDSTSYNRGWVMIWYTE